MAVILKMSRGSDIYTQRILEREAIIFQCYVKYLFPTNNAGSLTVLLDYKLVLWLWIRTMSVDDLFFLKNLHPK